MVEVQLERGIELNWRSELLRQEEGATDPVRLIGRRIPRDSN